MLAPLGIVSYERVISEPFMLFLRCFDMDSFNWDNLAIRGSRPGLPTAPPQTTMEGMTGKRRLSLTLVHRREGETARQFPSRRGGFSMDRVFDALANSAGAF
jgi:hypothetical protein